MNLSQKSYFREKILLKIPASFRKVAHSNTNDMHPCNISNTVEEAIKKYRQRDSISIINMWLILIVDEEATLFLTIF